MSSLFGWVYQFPYASLIIGALQILFIVHALLNRKPIFWVFVIFFIPVLGVALYFFMEVLPGLRRPRVRLNLEPALEGLRSSESRVQARREQLAELDTLQNRVALAAELSRAGRLEEAEAVLAPARTGIYADDPGLLYQLADLAFRQGKYPEARDLLERIEAMRSQALQARARTLLARTYEALSEPERAERLYTEATRSATGEEPRARYAEFLLTRGRREEAAVLLAQIEKTYRRANGLYRSQEREWFRLAEQLRQRARAQGQK